MLHPQLKFCPYTACSMRRITSTDEATGIREKQYVLTIKKVELYDRQTRQAVPKHIESAFSTRSQHYTVPGRLYLPHRLFQRVSIARGVNETVPWGPFSQCTVFRRTDRKWHSAIRLPSDGFISHKARRPSEHRQLSQQINVGGPHDVIQRGPVYVMRNPSCCRETARLQINKNLKDIQTECRTRDRRISSLLQGWFKT